jgi:hypothetical protein
MKRPRVYISPIRKEDRSWTRSDQDKADTYARHLERVFQLNDIVSELDIVQYSPLNGTREKIKYFTPIEIAREIDTNINPKKAPGYDQNNPKILKELFKKVMIHLTYIYNDILRIEYFPKQWKRAQVIMLLKPDEPPE